MRTHFIAIGGSAMHNLALALHNKGYQVTGSDDAIFEPSKTRLEKKGILPAEMGWFPEKITTDIEAIILGMHAKADNPELLESTGIGFENLFVSRIFIRTIQKQNPCGYWWFSRKNNHYFNDFARDALS